ncbi:MAG: serine protease family protein [Planctomycetota bacterium]|jgi:hypothetical protein
MRILTFIVIATTLLFSPHSAQTKDLILDQDQIANATVLLYQVKGGSGTVVVKDDRYYILTASHVAKELKNGSKIIFRLKGDKPGIFDLTSITMGQSLNWKHHSVADIALIELDAKNEFIKTILADYAYPAQLIHAGKDLPQRDADLTFLGYPVVDMEMEHFSPLIFTAYLSSGLITQKRYDTKTKCNFFYLNMPSIEGCSGSGVFFSVKKAFYMAGKTTLMIGIVHGTKGDSTGGKLAAITPSYYIFDLFEE